MNFEYLAPTQIIFGRGKLDLLGNIAEQYGNIALVVCGKTSMQKYGYLDRAIKTLKEAGLETFVFDEVSPNPKSDEINRAINMVRKNSCNLIIGLGGGSSIDAAKAISVGICYGSIEDIIGKTLEENPNSLPVISIPTTAGSGAEVTKGTIITDVQRKFKSGIRGKDIFSKAAIVDPELTFSLPKKITAETGFDALTHAIESYVARKANPVTDIYAENAIEIIANNLEKAMENERDFEAREKMSFAALIGGLNIGNASSCLPHRLQQAMGSVLEVSHGIGLASVYPAWLKYAYSYAKVKFDKIASIFEGESCEKSIIDFMKKIGVYCKLRDLGTKRGHIDKFLERISGNLTNDPIEKINKELIKRIYIESF